MYLPTTGVSKFVTEIGYNCHKYLMCVRGPINLNIKRPRKGIVLSLNIKALQHTN